MNKNIPSFASSVLTGILISTATNLLLIGIAITALSSIPPFSNVTSLTPPPTDITGSIQLSDGTLGTIELPLAPSEAWWEKYIIVVVGATLGGGIIAGSWAYYNLRKELDETKTLAQQQLNMTTRNALLDMLIADTNYRMQINDFLRSVVNGNIEELKTKVDCTALSYLFILKPALKVQLDEAIKTGEIEKVREYTAQLLTAKWEDTTDMVDPSQRAQPGHARSTVGRRREKGGER